LAVDPGWPKEPRARCGCISRMRMSNFDGESGRPRTCAEMSGGRYTQSDSAGGNTGTARMPIGFTRRDAHWRHLENTNEPSTCGGDAALCQITLTTCFSGCKSSPSLLSSLHLFPFSWPSLLEATPINPSSVSGGAL